MFRKILIANRGEIALRIIRTCNEMGIKTVAVVSQADYQSLHGKMAGECFFYEDPYIYMNMEEMVKLAVKCGAEAIHPGYGFQSENPVFSRLCENEGIKFIGPDHRTLDVLGNKIKAKKKAEEIGISVLPSIKALDITNKKIISQLDYPVLAKTTNGGGGRGIYKISTPGEMCNFYEQKDARQNIFIEKYLQKARHVEIQVLADDYGNVIHLGERDCSIQRWNQKIIEESPALNLPRELIADLKKQAVNLAASVGYTGAGTVEFLVDLETGKYYFMEMNPRIQVEHPVTEMVSGIDLIKQQILIAMGHPLQYKQKDIQIRGHAIECRINAERPDTFLPSPGVINKLIFPGGPWVRLDTHIYEGYETPIFYDSLIAKLVIWGNNREEAIMRMERALRETHIEGLETLITLHLLVIRHKEFRSLNIDTNFAKRILGSESLQHTDTDNKVQTQKVAGGELP